MTYTTSQLNSMRYNNIWRNSIYIPTEYENLFDYWQLFATGDATLDGRIYVAIPTNILITQQIKTKYNIM